MMTAMVVLISTLCIWGLLTVWNIYVGKWVIYRANKASLCWCWGKSEEALACGNLRLAKQLLGYSKKYGEIDMSGTPLDPELIYNKGEEE